MKRVLVALEYRAIKQAKEELDWLLEDAKKSIQAYIEDNSNLTELKSAQKLLHQAANTLQIMQVHGGVLLAREITEVVDALVTGKSERLTEAQEVVSDAVLRLTDYLEHVQAGHKDIPIVLLSLLNDLRAARNAPLLSENVLFFPEISNEALPDLTADKVSDIGAFLRRARISYEKALLQCISGNDTQTAGAQLCKVLVTLYRTSEQEQSQRFWWAASALAQAIAVNGLPFSPAVASLLSSIDRQIKHCSEMGAEVFAKQIPDSLFKNILYYIFRKS